MNRSGKGTSTVIRAKIIPGRNFEKPKTLSYTQLKEENSILQKQNSDLEHKFSKLNNTLSISQRNAKEFQKENKSLKEQIGEEQHQHAEFVESATREWTSQKQMLNNKLLRCEMKLEDLGMDPVALINCPNSEEVNVTKQEAMARAELLKEKLTETITSSRDFLHKIKEITSQSRVALKQLEC